MIMGYIESNLLPNETVLYRARMHWLIFAKPTILLIIGIALMGVGVGVFLIVPALLWLLVAFLKYSTSEYGVTDRRLIIKVGVLQRKTVELLLNKVESVGVDQGVIGRIFNYGSINISGTGGIREQFSSVSAPIEFRKQIQMVLV